VDPQYKRGIFAVGWRRVLDWMDWMLPEAWDAEHNKVHHYYLSEERTRTSWSRTSSCSRTFPSRGL